MTEKCPGCRSILTKKTRQTHTSECRKRFEKEIEKTEGKERLKNTKDRFDTWTYKESEKIFAREAQKTETRDAGGARDDDAGIGGDGGAGGSGPRP